jgi:hypothetical protein
MLDGTRFVPMAYSSSDLNEAREAGGFQISGFTDLLETAIAANVDKLDEARPRETHLGVLVARWDVSNEAAETRPAALPASVDTLWVIHPGRGGADAELWSLRRGEAEWRTHRN